MEFFIPQIGSFFLKGESQHPEELLALILHASSVDFYFAHRFWFFCQSVMFQSIDSETLTKSRSILKGLAKTCLEQEANYELLYLANSKDILSLISDLHLRDFYPSLQLFEDPNSLTRNPALVLIQKEDQLDKIIKAHEIQKAYCNDQVVIEFIDNHIGIAKELSLSSISLKKLSTEVTLIQDQMPEILEEIKTEETKTPVRQQRYQKVTAKEILLNTFKLTFHQEVSDLRFTNPSKLALMDAFLSTPRFIKALTDISMNLSFLQCSRKEKKAALMQDLLKVN